jgi:hypothetical protein
MDSH